MRYLDQHVRLTAESLENELARIAQFDEQAKAFSESTALRALLEKIKSGEIIPPSHEFDGFVDWFIPDDRYGTPSWASDLYYKKGEKKLSSTAAALSNLLELHNDLEFATHCRLLSHTFPDGWPNNPELFARTVQEAAQEAVVQKQKEAEQTRIGFRFKRFLHRLFHRTNASTH